MEISAIVEDFWLPGRTPSVVVRMSGMTIQLDNLLSFIEIQESTIEDLKKRVEQLEAEAKVHPLKKLLKHYNLFM